MVDYSTITPYDMGLYADNNGNILLNSDKFADFILLDLELVYKMDGYFYTRYKGSWQRYSRNNVKDYILQTLSGYVPHLCSEELAEECMTFLAAKANQR